VPVVAGAGGGAGKIIAGIGLLALAFFAPIIAGALIQTAAQAAFAIAIMPGLQAALVGLGIGAVVGGISQLLTPTPTISKDEGDPRKSFSFSGIQNTSPRRCSSPRGLWRDAGRQRCNQRRH
jgi:predicted phage tail protein